GWTGYPGGRSRHLNTTVDGAANTMTAKLNAMAFSHAEKLAEVGRSVLDDRDEWSENRSSAADVNAYIEEHGFNGYAPYGDFERVHRCGVLSAEVRAGQQKYADIENAAAHLHGLLDGRRAGNR